MNLAVGFLVSAIAGYIIGATPFGYFAGRLRGIDIRNEGSKNIGATNVWRVMGAAYGLPVFILDTLKGWLPAWAAHAWFHQQGWGTSLETAGGMAGGICAVLGHNFTFWLKGRGGKGVATSAGVLLGLAPLVVAVAAAVWAALFFGFRYSSLASLGAAVAVPLTMAAMMNLSGAWDGLLLGLGTLLCIMTVVRHRANIGRLLAGKELKVGAKKGAA